MPRTRPISFAETAKYGILLGTAGGLAEVVWIAFYGSMTGTDTAEVARAVSAVVGSMLPGISFAAAPVIFGVVLHMVIAVGIGIGLVLAWSAFTAHRPGRGNEYAFMVGALAIIWAFNFFVLLPLISPTFVELLPYPVSLTSKLLFGLAGAVAFRFGAGNRSKFMPLRVQALRSGK